MAWHVQARNGLVVFGLARRDRVILAVVREERIIGSKKTGEQYKVNTLSDVFGFIRFKGGGVNNDKCSIWHTFVQK